MTVIYVSELTAFYMLLNYYDLLQQLLVKTHVTLGTNFQIIRKINLRNNFM